LRALKKMFPMILNLLVANPEAEVNSAKQEELINQAREELSQAYNIFSNVSDPELVEIAVLNIKAAEKRFDFLVREIKRKIAE